MEAKVGMMEKLRRMFGGSPREAPQAPRAQQAPAAPAALQQSYADMIQEQARHLCADCWLANQIIVREEKRDGKTYLVSSPPEAAPYVRAAYEAKRSKLPADVMLA